MNKKIKIITNIPLENISIEIEISNDIYDLLKSSKKEERIFKKKFIRNMLFDLVNKYLVQAITKEDVKIEYIK